MLQMVSVWARVRRGAEPRVSHGMCLLSADPAIFVQVWEGEFAWTVFHLDSDKPQATGRALRSQSADITGLCSGFLRTAWMFRGLLACAAPLQHAWFLSQSELSVLSLILSQFSSPAATQYPSCPHVRVVVLERGRESIHLNTGD